MCEPLLTILIPTYNRRFYLEKTLSNLLSEIRLGEIEENVNILIGDNCSTDDTKRYLKESGLEFYTNHKNEGITGNITIGLSKIDTPYVWIFGDDDLLAGGALSSVICALENQIEDHSIKHLLLMSKSFQDELQIKDIPDVNRHKIEFEKMDSANIPHYFERESGFISAHIFNCALLNERLKEYSKDSKLSANNYLIKLLSYDFLYAYGGICLNQVCVLKRETHGSHFSNTISMIEKTFISDVNELYPYLKKIDNSLFEKQKKTSSNRRLLYLIVSLKSDRSFKLLIGEFVRYRKLYILALALIPRVFTSKAYYLYKKLKGSPIPPPLNSCDG